MAQLTHNPIQVAVAIIYDSDGRILITQRSQSKDHPGRWEFPGGKLAKDESAITALKREVFEEVGLTVTLAKPLTSIQHAYSHKEVLLVVYTVLKYIGYARCLEDQAELLWVDCKDLKNYSFPEANYKIINKLSMVC